MNRLFHWLVAASLGAGLLACGNSPLNAGVGSRVYNVPQAKLQEAVAKRFPYQQRLAEVLDLEVLAPRLTLLPESNRIGTALDLTLSDRLMRGSYTAAMAMDYGLRFEPSDSSIRMTGVRVNNVAVAGVPEPYRGAITRYAPKLAEQLLNDFVLHQFSEQEMSTVSGLGFEPGELKVTPRGLSVTLNPRKSL